MTLLFIPPAPPPHLEVVRQLRASRIAGVHGDEDAGARVDADVLALKQELGEVVLQSLLDLCQKCESKV